MVLIPLPSHWKLEQSLPSLVHRPVCILFLSYCILCSGYCPKTIFPQTSLHSKSISLPKLSRKASLFTSTAIWLPPLNPTEPANQHLRQFPYRIFPPMFNIIDYLLCSLGQHSLWFSICQCLSLLPCLFCWQLILYSQWWVFSRDLSLGFFSFKSTFAPCEILFCQFLLSFLGG